MDKIKVALFGSGNFGKVHANDLNQLGVLSCIVDVDPSKREVAERYNVPFFDINITQNLFKYRDFRGHTDRYVVINSLDSAKRFVEDARKELESGKDHDFPNIDYYQYQYKVAEKIFEEAIRRNIREIPDAVLEADAFDIVTDTPYHFPITVVGLELGKDVFVEKPPTQKTNEIEYLLGWYPKAKIGVDYIEMAHPVVLATKDNIDEEPTYYLHHRSKDLRGVKHRGIGGGEGSRIVLEDLVHDISEILAFRGSLENGEVKEAWIEKWKELDENKYPYNTDVKAQFTIKFPEAEAEIKGSFADPEVRQYVVVLNESFSEAIYGNTLTRDHISPVAARIEGKENVNYVLEKVREGKILDGEMQQKVLERVNAETLEEEMQKYVPECKWKDGKPVYGWAPLYNMLSNFLKAENNDELFCSLEKAHHIQKIAEEVYRVSRKEDAMYVE